MAVSRTSEAVASGMRGPGVLFWEEVMRARILPGVLSIAIRSVAILMLMGTLPLWTCCFAQTAGTGGLSGTVFDSSSGFVEGAHIAVTSQTTGEARTVTSNSRGVYAVPALPPGLYTLEASKDGFKTLHVRDVKITVTETTALDLRLEVGQVSERVIV